MKFIFSILISLSINEAVAQTSFENYIIKDVGYISIPTSLELQEGNYKEFIEGVQQNLSKKFKYEISDQRTVFQNKEVNKFDKDALNEYTRVIIDTKIGSYGDYEKLTTKIKVSKTELAELNNQIRKSAEEKLNSMGTKIIKWYDVEIVLLNGKTALKSSLIRQLNENTPSVHVTTYQFQNNDRMHSLTLSYREKDAIQWKTPFQKIVNSFVITNIR